MTETRKNAMILGSFVADAATMGLHWLYDQDRIRQIAPDAPEFLDPDPQNFADVPGYFAHPMRKAGDFSQYGEQQLVMLWSLAAANGYDRQDYINQFRAHFGYGGTYIGYIDRPTRDTLDTISKLEKAEDTVTYPGADDMQLPAISKLPVLVTRFHTDDALLTIVEDAVRVTNNNDTAVAFAKAVTLLLRDILQTGALPDFNGLLQQVDPIAADPIRAALSCTDETTQDITRDIGMSCQLDFGVPSIFHNLATAHSYRDGIRTNIYAGGDNCGRSIILGAALGAIHGIGRETSIPQDWITRLTRHDIVADHL